MQIIKLVFSALMLASLGAGAAWAGEAGHGDARLRAQASIAPERARAIALHARPGRVTDWELEAEAGGSGLRYSFDIRNRGVVYEVGIDARNGAVLENKREGANPD